MSNIQIFNFQSNQVRVQIISGKEYFCAKDVCNILEIKNSRDAISRIESEDVVLTDTPTKSGNQQMSFVNESGLYALIFQSRKEEVKEFKKWVFNVILPSIRKTGKFEIQQPKIDSQFLLQLAQEMAKKEQLIEEQAKEIKVLENTTQQQTEENQKLKTTIKNFFKGAKLFTRRQVSHFLSRQGLDVKEQQITDFLNKKKWLCKGEHNTNKSTAESCRVGWFVNDISVYEINGRKKTSEYGKFTVEGLVGVYELFKNKPAELNK